MVVGPPAETMLTAQLVITPADGTAPPTVWTTVVVVGTGPALVPPVDPTVVVASAMTGLPSSPTSTRTTARAANIRALFHHRVRSASKEWRRSGHLSARSAAGRRWRPAAIF
jgi:hypothetical protein